MWSEQNIGCSSYDRRYLAGSFTVWIELLLVMYKRSKNVCWIGARFAGDGKP